MNIIPDDEKLIGKTIVCAEIGGYGIRLKFSDGSILDYSSSSDGDSCWEIIDGAKQAEIGKLKPCPFCGGVARFAKTFVMQSEERQIVYCGKCWARTAGFDTQEEAAVFWNIRVKRSEKQ